MWQLPPSEDVRTGPLVDFIPGWLRGRGGAAAAAAVGAVRHSVGRVAAAVVGVTDTVVVGATQDATQILNMDMTTDTSRADTLLEALRYFDDSFLPFEFGGTWNIYDDSPFPAPEAGKTKPTFSLAFLESLRLKDHFIMLPDLSYISWECFIHLCRCCTFPKCTVKCVLWLIPDIKPAVIFAGAQQFWSWTMDLFITFWRR